MKFISGIDSASSKPPVDLDRRCVQHLLRDSLHPALPGVPFETRLVHDVSDVSDVSDAMEGRKKSEASACLV